MAVDPPPTEPIVARASGSGARPLGRGLAPLAPGERRAVTIGGRPVALFNVDGRVYAIGDRCPHRGGPLSRGRVEPVPGRGPAVRCPIHGWLFELATGRCVNQPDAGTPSYAVTCEGGTISVTA